MANKNNNNNKSINLSNKSIAYENSGSIFSNIYLIGFILLISLFFIGYAVYYYLDTSVNINILANSSFYGKEITSYEPLFSDTAKTIVDCVNTCTNDITCDGITYNSDTQMCTGTKNGQVRNETGNYSAWVKPPALQINNTTKDFMKSILVGNTKINKVINGKLLQNPYMLGFFTYSFNITIYDIYKNYGSWRHIFHKGTPIDNGVNLNYQSWENLVKDYPIQSIGVWLAPFTNNLRIAVTTSSFANKNNGSYSDAFIQKCNCLNPTCPDCYITDTPGKKWVDKERAGDSTNPKPQLTSNIEFFDNDLQNIPINKQINITINFIGTEAEVYIDGKIIKVVKLDGTPIVNNSSLYVMNDKSFGGEISNLLYYPDTLSLIDITSITKLGT
jgi:hypothetical protein